MNEPTDKPTGPQPPVTRHPATLAKPKILWKAVEARHYTRAQEIKAQEGKAAYNDYVVSLVERFEGEEPTNPTKAQTEAIVTAFQEKFIPAETPKARTQAE